MAVNIEPIYFTEKEIAGLMGDDMLCHIKYGGDLWLINPMTDGRYVLTQIQVSDRRLVNQTYYRELAEAREELLSRLSAMMRDLVF